MKKLVSTIALTATLVTTIYAGTVSLSWNPSIPAVDVVGYKVYQLSTTNGIFSTTNNNVVLASNVVGVNNTNATISNLPSGFVRFAVTAYNASGTNIIETAYSTEVSTNLLNLPSIPVQLKIVSVSPVN